MKRKDKDAPPPAADQAMTIPGDEEQSIYRFIIVAAKRARQLQTGARPKIPIQGRKVTRLAIEETRRGLVPHLDHPQKSPPEPPEQGEKQ